MLKIKFKKFEIFQNRKSLYKELLVVLKLGEKPVKITLILIVNVILSSKRSLKNIFDQKGGQKSKFQKIQKSTSRHFRNTRCVQIWSHSDENCGP